jgi:hypothetical protein
MMLARIPVLTNAVAELAATVRSGAAVEYADCLRDFGELRLKRQS